MSNGRLVDVLIVGNAPEELHRKAKRLKSLVRAAIGDVAHEGEDFIKRNFLQGQAVRKVSGELHESVQAFWAREKDSWWIKKGVRVRGNLNYVAQWIGTSREFMRPGFDRYMASRDVVARVAAKLENNL
jgi:HPt (histidine-containing phosphotransfer) domain-containing protein